MDHSASRRQDRPAPARTPEPAPAPEQQPTLAPKRRWTEGHTWRPLPGSLFAQLQIFGPPEQARQVLEQIVATLDVVLNLDATTELPPDAWDTLPARLLNSSQQQIVREDLRQTKRCEIARKLCLSANTITAYRNTIRQRFRSLPPERQPLWMQVWLRRFPGKAFTARQPKGGKPPR